MIFREVRSAQQEEIIQLEPTSIASPKHSVCSASSWTTPAQAAPRVSFLSAESSVRTPFRPPALLHRGPLHSAITDCACPRHSSSTAHHIFINRCGGHGYTGTHNSLASFYKIHLFVFGVLYGKLSYLNSLTVSLDLKQLRQIRLNGSAE